MATLRAVGANETPSKKITSVLEAADEGSRLDELIQLRRVIARACDNANTSPRDLAALSRRQIEISKEIEALRRQQAEEESDAANVADEAFDAEAI
jgi:predicted  nucleic acid-binding Zn-ribbon protein